LNLNDLIKSILSSTTFRIVFVFSILILVAAVCVFHFESIQNSDQYGNLFDSIWWAFVTVFTVGYGDIAPKSIGGRLIAIFVMFSGISLLSLITATISSIFVSKKIREDQGLESIKYENHIVVCGWNNRAESIVDTFIALSGNKIPKMILVNELPEDRVNAVLDKFHKYSVKFIRGDYTRAATLERANIKAAKIAILLPNLAQLSPVDADEQTVLATLTIRSMSSKLKIIAFIMNRENEAHVKRARADDVIVSDQYADFIVASNILEPGLTNILGRILSPTSKNMLTTLPIPVKFQGKKFREVFDYFHVQHHVLVIGLLAQVESIGLSDFLSADTSHLDAFIEKKLKEAGKTLGEENKVVVNLNPDDEYVIQENEKAIVIQ